MADLSAIPIQKITGGMATDDGDYVLIRAEPSPENEITLAVKHDQLQNLIDLLALGHMQSRKIQGVPLERRDVHRTTWWEISSDPTTGQVILSLTFGSGGRLDFALPGTMPAQMLETLRVLLQPSTFQTQQKPIN
jgi:hypothetical protein